MLKIVKSELFNIGQSFLDEVWGDEPDQDFQGKISPNSDPIDENNYEKYEPIPVQDPNQQQQQEFPIGAPDRPGPHFQEDLLVQPAELEVPEGVQEIEYPDGQRLAYDGAKTNEVISFDYTNRFGQYVGTRHVEPHRIFKARTTGNDILVTWDLDQNDIRAFIIGNIKPYGVRYEGYNFIPKPELMV